MNYNIILSQVIEFSNTPASELPYNKISFFAQAKDVRIVEGDLILNGIYTFDVRYNETFPVENTIFNLTYPQIVTFTVYR